MDGTLRGIVSGAVASAAALGAYFPLHYTVGVSFGFGAAVFVAGLLMLPRKKEADELVIEASVGLTQADLGDVLALIDGYRERILASKLAFDRLGHPNTAAKIGEILRIVEAVSAQTKKKPAEIPRVESFANYHLDRVARMLEEYADIADGLQTDRIRTEINRLKGILDVVREAYEDFYENLKLRRMDNLRIDGEAYTAVVNFERKENA